MAAASRFAHAPIAYPRSALPLSSLGADTCLILKPKRDWPLEGPDAKV